MSVDTNFPLIPKPDRKQAVGARIGLGIDHLSRKIDLPVQYPDLGIVQKSLKTAVFFLSLASRSYEMRFASQ